MSHREEGRRTMKIHDSVMQLAEFMHELRQ